MPRLTWLKAFGIFWLICLPLEAHATAHCFCKLGPISSPFHDFGQIKSYGTQIGHDTDCKNACNAAAGGYMSNAANKSAVCKAAGGGNVVSYSAVGTRPYIAGNSLTCPSHSGGTPGYILFGTIPDNPMRSITINGTTINMNSQTPIIIQNQGAYVTFTLYDYLSFHVQQWTYDAILYRDGVKIEQFSKKSPVAFKGSLFVTFTGQPNAFVHGHNWKIEWRYAGPNFQNGSATFHIN